jgi:putative spermidine/putrescine transport system permease protein
MNEKLFDLLRKALAYLALIFTLLPVIMIILGAFNPAPVFRFPPEGISLKWFVVFLNSKEYQSSITVSAIVAFMATIIGVLVGVPAAFAIDRYNFGAKEFIRSVFLSSKLLPRVIWAIGLLQFYASLRMLGSLSGLILAHSIIVLPFVFLIVLSSLAFVDRELEIAAESLGASPRRSFFEITVPLVMPGIIVSAILGFIASFTDVIVAAFISGTRNITFPVRIYVQQRGQGLDPVAVAGSAVVIVVILILQLVGEKLFRWSRLI